MTGKLSDKDIMDVRNGVERVRDFYTLHKLDAWFHKYLNAFMPYLYLDGVCNLCIKSTVGFNAGKVMSKSTFGALHQFLSIARPLLSSPAYENETGRQMIADALRVTEHIKEKGKFKSTYIIQEDMPDRAARVLARLERKKNKAKK